MTLNNVIEKYDLCEFHCDVILSPAQIGLCNRDITTIDYDIIAYVPACVSEMTEGRMQRGGTRRRVRMRSLGVPPALDIPNRAMSCKAHSA